MFLYTFYIASPSIKLAESINEPLYNTANYTIDCIWISPFFPLITFSVVVLESYPGFHISFLCCVPLCFVVPLVFLTFKGFLFS